MSEYEKDNTQKSTAPPQYQVSLRGFESEEAARSLGNLLSSYLHAIGRHIDISRLDGVTIAYDYKEALAALDRGYGAPTKVLTPTADYGVGVAMTPAVLRDGVVKAHIVLHAELIRPLEDQKQVRWKEALYLLAHECAHVEHNKIFDEAFPQTTLQVSYENIVAGILGQISEACWEEYVACRISAVFADDQILAGYEETFCASLKGARAQANEKIKAYRIHGNHTQILEEVGREYAAVLKYASYFLGHLAGLSRSPDSATAASAVLQNHWFSPYLSRLNAAFDTLWSRYSVWESRDEFSVIEDIARDIMQEGGLTIAQTATGEIRIDLPFTPETVPQPDIPVWLRNLAQFADGLENHGPTQSNS
jgi:hypothetical protein